MAAPFNFVDGFAVLCLRRLMADTVSMAGAVYRFLWLHRLTSLMASPFYAYGV
jgi:hypothetical protein